MGSTEIDFDKAVSALITETLGGSVGDPADRPDLHGDLPGVPGAAGRGVARIHDAAVPIGAGLFNIEAAISARLNAGAIDPAELPEPYDRYDADRLVEIWREITLPESYESSPVPLVGRLTTERILLTNGETTGIDGEFGLLGDRHLDLAVIQHSMHRALGAEAVFGFYEGYGADPNIVALDHFTLAALLLGWIE